MTDLRARDAAGGDRRLVATLGLIGAAFGLAMWGLIEFGDGMPDRTRFALSFGLIGAPLAFALTAARGQGSRSAVFAGIVALSVLILCWLGFRDGERADALGIVTAASVVGCTVAAGVAVLTERARQAAGARLSYPALFDLCVSLPVTLALAFAFTGIAWAVAWLIAMLFGAIGLGFVEDLLARSWFALPLSGAALLAAIGVVRGREGVIDALQSVLFGLARLVAPVLAVAVAVFAVALLFQGLGTLWEGLSPVATLTATAALSGLLVNACIGATGRPEGVPRWSALLLCLILPILMGLSAYGMQLRLGAEGLTPDRLYALLLVGLGLVMALAYAAAAALGAWQGLRRANTALLLCGAVTAVLVQTPLFRPAAWSAQSQANRLLSGKVAPEAFDFAYLRFGLGEAGERALDRIAARDEALAERVAELRTYEHRYEAIRGERAHAPLGERVTVRPEGATLPPALLAVLPELQRGQPGEGDWPVVVFMASEAEAWLLRAPQENVALLTIYTRTDSGSWLRMADLQRRAEGARSVVEAAANGAGFERVPVVIDLPQIGGTRFDPVPAAAMAVLGARGAPPEVPGEAGTD